MQAAVVEQVPVTSLVAHPENPRRGDLDRIVASIRTNGFFGALLVQRSTMRILAGNHRWRAAKQMGMEAVPVIFVDVDDAKARKILLADNRAADFASYDTESLTSLLKQVMAEDNLAGTGFDATDLQKLLGDVVDEPNEKRKRNLDPFHHCYFLVKAPITMQGDVTERLTTALSSLDGVEVASAQH